MRALEFITGHVIYNPAYTYKFQLKTTQVMQQFAYSITLLFGMLTPIANPILYSWLNESFRSAFREKCCCFSFKKKSHSTPPTDEFVTIQGTHLEALSRNPSRRPSADLGEFNISINGEKQIVTKRRAKVTSNQLQVYVSVPMDSEQSGGPITQPLLAKHENGCAGNGQKTAIIITQEC